MNTDVKSPLPPPWQSNARGMPRGGDVDVLIDTLFGGFTVLYNSGISPQICTLQAVSILRNPYNSSDNKSVKHVNSWGLMFLGKSTSCYVSNLL